MIKGSERQCVPSIVQRPTASPEKAEQYLGDYTKKLLENTKLGGLFPDGITSEAIAEIKKKHGFAPTCGGCDVRQKWLNEVDKTARSWARKGLTWLKEQFGVKDD